MLKASLIISFYKRIDYLHLVFAGLINQTEKNFEVIIADDGSNSEVLEEVERLMNDSKLNSIHIWHEDKGFRKNKILNRAIESAQSDYLIFIDGDCIPHPNFIEEHIKHSESNVCLTGRRVNLSEKVTASLTPDKIISGKLQKNFYKIIFDGILGKSFDVEKGFYLKSDMLKRKFNEKKRGILGCNFSINKSDMYAINGFDERYQAPSIGEDSDIEFRLRLIGKQIKSLNNIAIQYHLYHKLQLRPQANIDLFEQIKNEAKSFTNYGITQSH